MDNVNYISIIKKIIQKVVLLSTLFVVFMLPISFKYKTSFDDAINSISSIRGYQGLVLDDSGLVSSILNVFEKTSRAKILEVSVFKEGHIVFARNVDGNDFCKNFYCLNSVNLHGFIDGYEISAVTEVDASYILMVIVLVIIILIGFEFIVKIKRHNKQKEHDVFLAGKISAVSQQVSHDIRSPLAALEMLSFQLQDLSEEKRVLLRNSITRIRDIANSLVNKKNDNLITIDFAQKNNEIKNSINSNGLTNVLLAPLVDSLVTEKRIENRANHGIEIEFSQVDLNYGLFSKINSSEFLRIVSNLLNNSIESFDNKVGRVVVSLGVDSDNFILLKVSDNGKGVLPEVMEKLFKRGASFGKASGMGLGLYNAKEVVESWGGKISIESKPGVGTAVCLRLQPSEQPLWFIPKIKLNKNSLIVVFDDDLSIHQVWESRFSLFNLQPIIHLTTVDQFRQFYRKNFAESDCIYLVDYEIVGEKLNGLDLIEEFRISNSSILVTSRYDQDGILERCEKNKVSLIPKNMSGFVPIEII